MKNFHNPAISISGGVSANLSGSQLSNLAILDHLLQNSLTASNFISGSIPDSILDFEEWKKVWASLVPKWETPIDRALFGGLCADRPAWAFAAGYQAAIQSLTSSLNISDVLDINDICKISAICITEKGGAHPAQIKSCLEPIPEKSKDGKKTGYWRLNGYKTFISGAEQADVLWVAASIGQTAKGQNQLRMVKIPSQSHGLKLSPMSPLGIVPEVPHAEMRFDSLILKEEAIVPGDAYLNMIKPFRTLEDIHVTASFLAWIFSIGGKGDWPQKILEEILSLILSVRGLAFAPPLAAHVHIALGGFRRQVNQLLTEIEPYWKKIDSITQERWQRDRKLLQIAEKARSIRLSNAWQNYAV